MARRRFRDRQRRPSRSSQLRPPRRRLLVLCEGRVTEPSYIRGLERWLRNAAVEVVISDVQGVPKTLVDEAIALNRAAEREAKRQRDDFLRYDEVWCVFDVDAHPHLAESIQRAAAHGIQLAISNPCFELWLLLHFRDSPGARQRREMQKLLRQQIPGYAKRIDFDIVSSGLNDACQRASRLDREARLQGEERRNPTTGLYRLVSSIEG
ncbi:MAG: RloB family protein [Acidobacteriota bacterium]